MDLLNSQSIIDITTLKLLCYFKQLASAKEAFQTKVASVMVIITL